MSEPGAASRVRVGVSVGHPVRGPAGPRRYSRALCDALRELPQVDIVELPTPPGEATARRIWDLIGISLMARQRSVDLVHCTGIYAPLASHQPVVLTVHDLAIQSVPEAFPPLNRRLGWPVWSYLARRADHLIAISVATRREASTWLRLPPERVTVVHHGVGKPFGPPADTSAMNSAERARRAGAPAGDYFLTVGTIEPRKNLARVLAAFQLVRASGCEAHLVIVGGVGWGQAELRQRLARGGFGPAVHYLGRACDDDLAALYRGAVGLVYPSLYEGFGLPVLEAMACGCPVVTSGCGGLAEAAGDAARLVDPLSVPDIASAMQALMADPTARADLARRGLQQAAGRSWRQTAEQTLDVYRHVLEGSRHG